MEIRSGKPWYSIKWHESRIIQRSDVRTSVPFVCFVPFLTINLHSPERRLIELQIEHADLDAWIDRLDQELPADQLMLRRLKKRRLILRDEIVRLEMLLGPKEPA
jgi:hypothetical protein